jgi:CRP-like cAMP-binding protein
MMLREYEAGEIIFRAGDRSEYLYVIAHGQVGIYADEAFEECVVRLGIT